MINKLTVWRANHANKPMSSLYPLTYLEIVNAASLAGWTISFLTDVNIMQRALDGTPMQVFAEQNIWTIWMITTLFLLTLGYYLPQAQIHIRTFYVNGRSLGLIMSTAIWTMFSSFLWLLSYDGLFNLTYTALAFCLFMLGTKVLAYER